jgi:hypothetical protein
MEIRESVSAMTPASGEWYFLCGVDGATWFHDRPACKCPSCGRNLIAVDRFPVPRTESSDVPKGGLG